MKELFLLNPEYTYLNHGSFGACPKMIFNDYQHWQLELELEPVNFITNTGVKQLDISKAALANYISCDPEDLIYVTNPSYAMNIVAKSLDLKEGDEILSTNLEYGAMDRTWNYYCKKTGAKYIRQQITLPVRSHDEIIDQFWKGLTKNTKAIFISHITSTTGMILPVEEICIKAKELGLLTIVDGAHVPGHIPLDLSSLQADIYTGACHKWLLTPKGCSFLYVRKQYQDEFDPLIISWGYDSDTPGPSRFVDYHQYQGTRDFSAFLTVPKALEFFNQYNWTDVAAHCRSVVQNNNQEIASILNTHLLCPNNDEHLGQMCSIPVQTSDPVLLKQTLFNQYKIEIPVMTSELGTFIRFSVQAYTTQDELNYLKQSLQEIISKTDLIKT